MAREYHLIDEQVKPLEGLVIGQNTLHGKYASAGEATLSWLPIGALKAVNPAKGAKTELSRASGQSRLDTGAISPNSLINRVSTNDWRHH
jgi:hypothetical protein